MLIQVKKDYFTPALEFISAFLNRESEETTKVIAKYTNTPA